MFKKTISTVIKGGSVDSYEIRYSVFGFCFYRVVIDPSVMHSFPELVR